ncbi:MAG: HNH endonuclease signature motif containing protein [Lacisediminihabitans sp.]
MNSPMRESLASADALDLEVVSDAELLQALESGFARKLEAEARLVRIAAEIVRRSRSSLGPEGLSIKTGSGSPAALLADIGRISLAEANRLCRVGEATAARVSLLGERMPAAYPLLAGAVAAGSIPLDSANWIVSALAQAAPRADVVHLEAAERALVEFALDNPADSVRKLAARWRDALDVDGIEPREEELAERKSLRRTVLANGMKRYVLDLDPVGSAFLDAAIDAHVGSVIRSPRFESGDNPDACGTDHGQLPDPRTTAQLGADAIVDLARHCITCTSTEVPLPNTTIVVRMTLDALLTGLGEAHLDGIEQPISATTARRLAADAHIIPMVLGGAGEVLDLGVPRRIFSRAQRLALAERDDGCAWRNCRRPPSCTEAHHIRWWSRGGPTDLNNGILLCSMHHHRVHRDGWEITVTDNVPWFTPPSSVDIYRTPRRGGRLPAPDLMRRAG